MVAAETALTIIIMTLFLQPDEVSVYTKVFTLLVRGRDDARSVASTF